MRTESTESQPARGRPRDVGRDLVILDAALGLLTELGYDRLSIESVATRAGVSKATIYRRYPHKAAVVAAAIERRAGGTPPRIRSSDLRDALLEVLEWLAEQIAGQDIGLLTATFVGMRNDPDLAAAMQGVLRRDQAAMTEEPLRRALDRGDHLAPRAAELFAEIAPAVILHRIVVGEQCDRPFLEHLTDDVLLPLIRTRASTHHEGTSS